MKKGDGPGSATGFMAVVALFSAMRLLLDLRADRILLDKKAGKQLARPKGARPQDPSQ